MVAAGRLRAAARADRHRLRLIGLPRRHHAGQWLEPDRHPCAHLYRPAKILASDSQTHDPRRRTENDPRDRLPFELCQAHAQLRRVQGLLARQLLRQGGADRGILGVPAGRGGHGPVAAAQVRGDRAGLRGAAAIYADPRREEARRRPGRLHRHVLRAWRHDRRRHAAAARQGQFPLGRRRRFLRRVAARAGGQARPQGAWCARRPTRCTTSPCRGRRAATS